MVIVMLEKIVWIERVYKGKGCEVRNESREYLLCLVWIEGGRWLVWIERGRKVSGGE